MKTAKDILTSKEGFRGANHIFHYTVVIQAMEEYAEQFKPNPPTIPKKSVWQSSTLQQPDVWTDRTDEEYELMGHLARFTWRQIEK